MKHITLFALVLLFSAQSLIAQKQEENDAAFAAQIQHMIDSISNSYKYQTGQITLGENLATLQVPAGFRYLDATQSRQVLEDLWGNPPGHESSLGMLFPENRGPLDSATFAFHITFDDMGYVKDDDADKIDYNDLLKNIKDDVAEANKERIKQGFDAVDIIGWASQPFYDKEKKVLHWAKEFRVGEESENTLNYDIRVLGRKGVLSMNAISSMNQLNDVKNSIPGIINSVAFSEGNRYSDYSASSGDKVAAWTIGGLVAGKVLAKAGFFAVLLKFGKVIIVGLLAGLSAIWRFITGRKKEEEEEPTVESDEPSNFESFSSVPEKEPAPETSEPTTDSTPEQDADHTDGGDKEPKA